MPTRFTFTIAPEVNILIDAKFNILLLYCQATVTICFLGQKSLTNVRRHLALQFSPSLKLDFAWPVEGWLGDLTIDPQLPKTSRIEDMGRRMMALWSYVHKGRCTCWNISCSSSLPSPPFQPYNIFFQKLHHHHHEFLHWINRPSSSYTRVRIYNIPPYISR